MLANLEGVDLSTYKSHNNFTDVKSTDWFSGAVNWASENGVVSGSGNGKFNPNENVSREQMCVMLINYATFKGITLNEIKPEQTFADDDKISSWAKTAQTSSVVITLIRLSNRTMVFVLPKPVK